VCVCSLCVVVLFENLNHKPRTTLKKPNDLEFGVWRLAFGVWRLAFGVWSWSYGVGSTWCVVLWCRVVVVGRRSQEMKGRITVELWNRADVGEAIDEFVRTDVSYARYERQCACVSFLQMLFSAVDRS